MLSARSDSAHPYCHGHCGCHVIYMPVALSGAGEAGGTATFIWGSIRNSLWRLLSAGISKWKDSCSSYESFQVYLTLRFYGTKSFFKGIMVRSTEHFKFCKIQNTMLCERQTYCDAWCFVKNLFLCRIHLGGNVLLRWLPIFLLRRNLSHLILQKPKNFKRSHTIARTSRGHPTKDDHKWWSELPV